MLKIEIVLASIDVCFAFRIPDEGLGYIIGVLFGVEILRSSIWINYSDSKHWLAAIRVISYDPVNSFILITNESSDDVMF